MVGKRTAVAISEAADGIRKIQAALIGVSATDGSLPDSLEGLTRRVELHLFAGAFYEESNEALNEARDKASCIREKAAQAAKLLREIECEIDRLHSTCLAVQ